jgi:DNA-binding CsgD family transcriptional regulator
MLGHRPLLAFRHLDQHGPATDARLSLEPIAAHILALVAQGATATAIARTVGLTVAGVNYHLAHLCQRLNVPKRTALVGRAYVLGLLVVCPAINW